MSYSTDKLSVLNNGWTTQVWCQYGTTFFFIFEILKEISVVLKVIMKEILTEMKRIMRLIVILMRLMWGELSMQIKINITFIKWDFHIYTIGEPHFCNKSHTIFVTKKKTGLINPALIGLVLSMTVLTLKIQLAL